MNYSAMLIPLLLLLSLLSHRAQGMGLGEEVNSKHLLGNNGRARKLLITSPIPTTAAIAKNANDKKKGKSVNLTINSSSTTEKRPTAADETYPGILDLAGMDYSEARRKPPIHN